MDTEKNKGVIVIPVAVDEQCPSLFMFSLLKTKKQQFIVYFYFEKEYIYRAMDLISLSNNVPE